MNLMLAKRYIDELLTLNNTNQPLMTYVYLEELKLKKTSES